jgi:hypothetical protein
MLTPLNVIHYTILTLDPEEPIKFYTDRPLVVSLSDLVELVEFDIKRKQSRLATEL